MSDTPRTDAAEKYIESDDLVFADFARQLERELAAASDREHALGYQLAETERLLAEERQHAEDLKAHQP